MKFVSSKKIVDHARDLAGAQREREALKERLKSLDAEIEALEVFLQARKPDGFRFADARGYLMQALIVPGQRKVLDLAKIERDYARRGLVPPRKTSRWCHIQIDYVTEAE